MEKHYVVKELEESAKTFKERNELYGDTYKNQGSVFSELFKDGVTLKTQEDFKRFALLLSITTKIVRYVSNWDNGGHYDSMHDISVYAAMLNDVDANYNSGEDDGCN